MRKVAAYVRVSSVGQNTDGQEAELRKWLEGHVVDLDAVRWFVDRESGKTTERPALAELRGAIFKGEIEVVVLYKLDRLSRQLRDGINLLADWCERGVRVVVVTQQLDLSGPVGRMIAAVLFGLAEIELEFRRERQSAGIEAAKRKGVYKGRKKGTLKARPGRARELAQSGLSAPEIARSLGVSERTVWRYLREE